MKTILASLLLLFTLSVAQAAQLPRAGTCGSCHVENFNDWHASDHAQSIASERFRKNLRRYLLREDTENGEFCFRCHAPAVLITGDVFAATKMVLRGNHSMEGVTCVVCHSVESIKEGKALYAAGNVPAYHRVKDLQSIDRAALCTTCHGAYTPDMDSPVNVEEKGFLTELVSGLKQLVSGKTIETTDHGFPGFILQNTDDGGDGLCPGQEKGL